MSLDIVSLIFSPFYFVRSAFLLSVAEPRGKGKPESPKSIGIGQVPILARSKTQCTKKNFSKQLTNFPHFFYDKVLDPTLKWVKSSRLVPTPIPDPKNMVAPFFTSLLTSPLSLSPRSLLHNKPPKEEEEEENAKGREFAQQKDFLIKWYLKISKLARSTFW